MKKRSQPSRVLSNLELARVVGGTDESRNIEFEMIKNEIQKLPQMLELGPKVG